VSEKKTPNKNRLLELATHLESGQLGATFNFGVFYQPLPCGAMACALGECLTVWPYQWGLNGNLPTLKGTRLLSPLQAAREWFELDIEQARYLFLPSDPATGNNSGMPATATRERVARHIRNFAEQQPNPPNTTV
jgi:hypothetical protein